MDALDPLRDPEAPTDFDGEDVLVTREDDGSVTMVPRSVSALGGETRALVTEATRLAAAIAEAQADLAELVGEMREAGVSWSAIGWAVGTTGEAARQRWG